MHTLRHRLDDGEHLGRDGAVSLAELFMAGRPLRPRLGVRDVRDNVLHRYRRTSSISSTVLAA